MSPIALFLLAVLAGALGGVHVPINGALAMRIGSTLLAVALFYAVALLVSSSALLLTWNRGALTALRDVPAAYWILPGLISVAVVGASTYLIPRLGAVNVFVITVSAQSVVRLVISHFGWLDSPVDPISGAKLAGAAFVVLGAFLVVRS